MLLLVIGLVTFFAIHLLPANQDLRDGLVKRLGYRTYMLFFACFSLGSFALIVIGYHKLQLHPGKNPLLWTAPEWTRHLALAAMLVAFILLTAAYVPSRIRNWLRHPMLIALLIWGSVHLIVNGDLGSLALFGSFIVYALYGLVSAGAGGATGPLGNRQPGSILNDIAVVLMGAAAYYVFVKWGHPALIGVTVLPG